MIQIYCGDGKGKTTAAIGAAIRAAGHGIPVIFAQLLKDDTSGEISILRGIAGINVMHADCFYGFFRSMTDKQKAEVKEAYEELLDKIKNKIDTVNERLKTDIGMVVVLDEVFHAVNFGLLDEECLVSLMLEYKAKVEFVLTGRNPSERLIGLADYVSEVVKRKHPFDEGISARNGIEQ